MMTLVGISLRLSARIFRELLNYNLINVLIRSVGCSG